MIAKNMQNSVKKWSKRVGATYDRIYKLGIDELEDVVSIGNRRLSKYLCTKCKNRYRYPHFKVGVIKQGEEFYSEYHFDSFNCLLEWIKEAAENLKEDFDACECVLLDEEENGKQ